MGNKKSIIYEEIYDNVAYYKVKKLDDDVNLLSVRYKKIAILECGNDDDRFSKAFAGNTIITVGDMPMSDLLLLKKKDKYGIICDRIDENSINIISTLHESILMIHFSKNLILENNAKIVDFSGFEKIVGKKVKLNSYLGNITEKLVNMISSLPELISMAFDSIEMNKLSIDDIIKMTKAPKLETFGICSGKIDMSIIEFCLENIKNRLILSECVDNVNLIKKLKYNKIKINELVMNTRSLNGLDEIYSNAVNILKINNCNIKIAPLYKFDPSRYQIGFTKLFKDGYESYKKCVAIGKLAAKLHTVNKKIMPTNKFIFDLGRLCHIDVSFTYL